MSWNQHPHIHVYVLGLSYWTLRSEDAAFTLLWLYTTVTSSLHRQVLGGWKSIKLVGSYLAFHFVSFYSRRFVWKYNDNRSSRFKRLSQEEEKDRCTQTENWKHCQQQLGKWQALKWVTTPQSADTDWKEQQSHWSHLRPPPLPFMYLFCYPGAGWSLLPQMTSLQ